MAYELLVVAPEVRRQVTGGADGEAIHTLAVAAGRVPLTQHALWLARAGVISLAEAYRTRLS